MAPGSHAPAELPALLRKMYRERRLFTTLLLNLDMVPTKSDIAIASRYAALVGHSLTGPLGRSAWRWCVWR